MEPIEISRIRRGFLRLFSLAAGLELLIELISRRSLYSLGVYIISNPLAFLYNALVIMLPLMLAGFFRRRRFVLGLISLIWLILGIANGVLLSVRVTPFCPTDLLLVKDAFRIMGNYLRWYYIAGLIVLILAIVMIVRFLYRRFPRENESLHPVRLTSAILAMVFAVLLMNQAGRITGFLTGNFSNIAEAYRKYGFACCFTYGIFDTGINRPKDYSPEIVDEIVQNVETAPETVGETEPESIVPDEEFDLLDELTGESEPEDVNPFHVKPEHPNVIYVQLESLFDVTTLDYLTFSEDPLPNLHALSREYTSGWMNVPCIGAGTANTEFETITGMNLDFFGPGEYPYKTVLKSTTCETMCYDLKAYGYRTHAIHNNTGVFYARDTVFPQLGFDTFTSSEFMEQLTFNENGYVKDEVLVQQIIDAIRETDDPDLIYTISVQGHGAYPTEDILDRTDITLDGIEDEAEFNQFTYYVNQIHQMDAFVRDLIMALKATGEDCVLVLYGDHLPSLNIPEENIGGNTLFQTPLVIWDNIGLEKETIDIQAYQLHSYVANRLDFHEGVVMKLHQSRLPELLALNPDKMTPEDPGYESYNEYLEKLKTIEYDVLYGDHEATGGTNPYAPTDMKLGINDISIHKISLRDGTLYVTGEHFTTSSKVMINGRMAETTYLMNRLLSVPDFVPEKEQTLQIVQYAEKDKVILSSTPEYTIRQKIEVELGDPTDTEE